MTAAASALALLLLAAAPAGEPLDPEVAFPATVSAVEGRGLDVRFRIPAGYYLYRDRFRFSVAGPALPLGTPVLPPGETLDDPFIGRTEILRESAAVHLPFTGSAAPGTYTLQVTAQGCMEGRVCYTPFTQAVKVRLP